MKEFINFILTGVALTLVLIIVIVGVSVAFKLGSFIAEANTATVTLTVPCTNQNWQHSPRCTASPVLETMIINPWGVSSGELTSGVKWTQTRVTDKLSLFKMEEVSWLTDGKTIVYLP